MLEGLKEYGERIIKKMGYSNVKLEILFDESLGDTVVGSLEIFPELERLYDELDRTSNLPSLEEIKALQELKEEVLRLESLKWYEIPHGLRVLINPKNARSKEKVRDTIRHEIGHYHLERAHSNLCKIFRYSRKPEYFLKDKNLWEYVVIATGVGSLSTGLLSLASYVPEAIPLSFSLTGLILLFPHLIEEKLATHYGNKYKPDI